MAGMNAPDSPGGDRSYEMGLHTEQLAGRTQQVFFRPEEEERFVYPWAPDVDYDRRTEIDADAMTSTEMNAKLRALMNVATARSWSATRAASTPSGSGS